MSARRYARVAGVAVHLPDDSLTSAELEERLAARHPGIPIPRGTIEQVSGVRRRHLAAHGQNASDLAVAAAHTLLRRAGRGPGDLDLIIFSGVSVDAVEPATAHLVAAGLGATCPVFDVRNACNSLITAIELADALIVAGRYRRVMIACGEVATPAMRRGLGTAEDFVAGIPSYTVSDSGAALLVEAGTEPGILGHRFCARSEFWRAAIVPVTRTEEGGYRSAEFVVDPFELSLALRGLDLAALSQPLTERGLTWKDPDVICAHQPSLAALDWFCDFAGLPREKVEITVVEHGNLVAASLAMQLHQAERAGRLRPGDLVALVGVASGLSAGTVLLRW